MCFGSSSTTKAGEFFNAQFVLNGVVMTGPLGNLFRFNHFIEISFVHSGREVR